MRFKVIIVDFKECGKLRSTNDGDITCMFVQEAPPYTGISFSRG